MSSHSNSSSAASDPRQPSTAKPYIPPVVAPQDLPFDYSGFIAIICGVTGVMFRYKLCSWLAILFCAQSLASMKNFENDLKQISMAMIPEVGCGPQCHNGPAFNYSTSVNGVLYLLGLIFSIPAKFAIMGLVTNYFGPARPGSQS